MSALRRNPRAPAALALALLALLLAPGCARLRGPDYGPAVDPYRKADLPEVPGRKDEPVFRLVLAGDAGYARPRDPTLALLGRVADRFRDRTLVVYLGDNLYPAGLQPGDRGGEAVLLRQIRAARARKLFVPGNHDWGHTPSRDVSRGVLESQQRFLEKHAAAGVEMRPRGGCPGPDVVDVLAPGAGLEGGLVLVVLDLHWWLLPDEERPPCAGIDDTRTFLARFEETLERHRDRNVVVAAHHPIVSGGPHGGQSRGFWTDVGVALASPFYRIQDVFEPGYQEMVRLIEEAMRKHPPLAMAGGHDHSLQVLEREGVARVVVVSGAASQVSRVTSIDGTLFAHAHLGFVTLDLYRLGAEETALVRVFETGRGEEPVFTLAIDLAREQAPPRPVADPGGG